MPLQQFECSGLHMTLFETVPLNFANLLEVIQRVLFEPAFLLSAQLSKRPFHRWKCLRMEMQMSKVSSQLLEKKDEWMDQEERKCILQTVKLTCTEYPSGSRAS